MTDYQKLAKENQYLYGQMENCTQLMGLAVLTNHNEQYDQFLRLKSELKEKVNINLGLIEEIWQKPVIERKADRRPLGTNFRNECNIISALNTESHYTVTQMAKMFKLTEVAIKNIIKKYDLDIDG